MENKWLISPQDIQIRGLLDRYTRARFPVENASTAAVHLDDDALTAFIEGNISEREAKPIISHLVECSFCRHITAELIRLETALAEDDTRNVIVENQPSRVSEVLNNLLSRIFGANEGAVFAHQENEETEPQTEPHTDSEK